MIYAILFVFLFFPVLSLIWFLISLVQYLKAPKESELRKSRRSALVTSGVVTGVLFGIVLGVVLLFFMAIAYM